MDLDKLKELEAKATQGYWWTEEMDGQRTIEVRLSQSGDSNGYLVLHDQEKTLDKYDHEFICELRNSAKEMIETIERYKTALEKIATEADKCGKLMEDNQPSQRDLMGKALEALKDPEKT